MESGGGGLFMKLAPELLLVFLNYLYLHDIAKLRFVSKWFDERICSLMPSKFRSFKIRLSSCYMEENCKSILGAMKKPNGHLNLLDLYLNTGHHRVKEILNDYKDNISALDLPFSEQLGSDMVSFLQHENTRFPLLEKLTIEKDKRIENLLKKHAEQLTYLKLNDDYYDLNFAHNYPHFPKLETLIVKNICHDDFVSLLSLCSESLSSLRIIEEFKEMGPVLQQLPELPKLKTIDIYSLSLGQTVKSLLSKCRQTLTGIVFVMFDLEMEDKYFPKLKYMKFQNVYNVDMIEDIISANACQLETLILFNIHGLILPNALSNIKNLFIYNCQNLDNILKCASLLQCLVLRCYDEASDLEYLKDIKKMPNLTDIYLLDINTSNCFMYKSIKDFLIKNADTLEFLLVHFFYSGNMESTPPPVELKKVHTLIILQDYSFLESGREFFKALCPNAQIMMQNGNRGKGEEYIREARKLRLKYHKADYLFCQEINNMKNLLII